jgi:hypothetical protein
MTVHTAKGIASLSPLSPAGNHNSPRGFPALAFGLILPLFGIKRLRRQLRTIPKPLVMILFAVLTCSTILLVGCGGGGFFGPTATSGHYTITITATSADLVRTSTVQLIIQ